LGCTNSDWVGSDVDPNSTIGGCFYLGSSMVSWTSIKKDSIALSSAKDEYITTNEVGREVVWLRKLLAIFLKDLWILPLYVVTTKVE